MTTPIGLPPQPIQKKPTLKSPTTKFGATASVNSSQEFNISSLGIPTTNLSTPKKLTVKEQIENYLNKKFYNPERNANIAGKIAESAGNRQGAEKKAYIREAADNYLKQTAPKERPDIARLIQEEARFLQEEENKPSAIKKRIETQLDKNSDNRERNANLATTITKFALKKPVGEQREAYIQEATSNYLGNLAEKENQSVAHLSYGNNKALISPPTIRATEAAQDIQEPEETPEAEEVNNTSSTEPPAKTGEPNTQQGQTNDATKKEEEKGGVIHGWKKTKLATGAGLLAGGIALKMTLIGIVPGLIMAGAGAAVMGWGLLNYIFSGKKDDAKKEGEQTPAAS